MKYIPLVWAGLWRKPLRTLLTTLALIVAFVLFGTMQGINAGFTAIRDSARMDALLVQSRYAFPMPIAYRQQILQMPGIKTVTAQANMGGIVNGDRTKRVGINFADEGLFAFYTWMDVTPDQIAALRAKRTGVILGKALAETLGLKAGDHFVINSQLTNTHGGSEWPLDVVAVADRKDIPDSARFAVGNIEYLNEDRSTGKDSMNIFMVVVNDPNKALATAKAIDDTFLSSTAPTRTIVDGVRAEQQYQDDTTHVMVNYIVIATLFSLLIMTFNSMMQSFRERIPELGTFKAMGFTDRQVLGFVLCEAAAQCLVGASIGLVLARILVPYSKTLLPTGPTGNMTVSPWVFALGLGVAFLVALASAALPAWRAKRLQIVEALAVR